MTNTIGQREKLERTLSPFFSAARQIDDLPACDRLERQRELEVQAASFVLAALSSPPAGEGELVAFNPFGTGLSEPRLTVEQMNAVTDKLRKVADRAEADAHPPSAGEEKTGEREALISKARETFAELVSMTQDEWDLFAAHCPAGLLDRLLLALSPTSGGGTGERYYSAAELIEASKRLTTSSVRPAPADLPMPTYIYQPLDMTGGQSSDASKVYRPTSDAAPSSPEVIGDSE